MENNNNESHLRKLNEVQLFGALATLKEVRRTQQEEVVNASEAVCLVETEVKKRLQGFGIEFEN